MNIKLTVCWFVMQHSMVGRCQYFRETCCAFFYPNVEAAASSKSSIPTNILDIMFQRTCPLVRNSGLMLIICSGTKFLKTWSYLRNCQTDFGWNLGLWVRAQTSSGNFNFSLHSSSAMFMWYSNQLIFIFWKVAYHKNSLHKSLYTLFISKLKNIYFIYF